MSETHGKSPPHLTDRAQAAKAEREARLAKALRANLRRRKGQGTDQRGGAEAPAGGGGGETDAGA